MKGRNLQDRRTWLWAKRGCHVKREAVSYEAFEDLRRPGEFVKVFNGGYFVEWECGADLSADTIEAHWKVVNKAAAQMLITA